MSSITTVVSRVFAFKDWTPSPVFTGLTTSNVSVVRARYIKIFKFVIGYLHITFDVSAGTGDQIDFDLPVAAANTDYSGVSPFNDPGISNYLAGSVVASSTTVGSLVRSGNWSTNNGNIVKGIFLLEAA